MWISKYYGRFQTILRSNGKLLEYTGCANGDTCVNFDVSGNVYTCRNIAEPIGTYKDDNAVILDNMRRRQKFDVNKNVCVDCEALPLCAGGCAHLQGDFRERYYCDVNQTIYRNVKEAFQHAL